MTVALLVAIPCELVATALYSAVSFTAHLQNNEHIIISCSQTGTLRVTGVKLGSDFTFLDPAATAGGSLGDGEICKKCDHLRGGLKSSSEVVPLWQQPKRREGENRRKKCDPHAD